MRVRIFRRKLKGGIRWGLDFTVNGVRKRTLVADTRKEAIEYRDKVIINQNNLRIGLPAENERQIPENIDEAINLYFAERVSNLRSTNVVKVALGEGSEFRKRFGKLPLDGINRVDIENLKNYFLKKNYALNSAKRMMISIQSFFSWCVDREWIEKNPVSRLWKNRRVISNNPGYQRQILSIDQVDQLIDMARRDNLGRGDLWEWLFVSMQRPSEARKIRLDDFYKERGMWYLRITQTKRGDKVKILEIDGPLLDIYERHLKKRGGQEFMWEQSLFDPHSHWLKKYYRQMTGEDLRKGNGNYIFKHSAVSYHLNVLATPIQIVSDISDVSIPVLINFYTKSTESQRRTLLKNLSWHGMGTNRDAKVSKPLQNLDNPALEKYPS